MTRTFKNPLTSCSMSWKSAPGPLRGEAVYRKYKLAAEMYALSDFLIMVFVMVSEAVT